MKIVIEIDEERYEDTKRIASVQMNYRTPTIEQIVANGTPLDKMIEGIKTDIEKATEDFYYDEHDLGVRAGFRFALEIIDKYRKEQEGSDKE